jgi:uncharacterized protein (TIGR03083 family)
LDNAATAGDHGAVTTDLGTAFRGRLDALLDTVGSARTLDVRVPGMDWSAAEVAAHLVIVYRAFGEALAGVPHSPELRVTTQPRATLPEFLAETNAAMLAQVRVSGPADAVAQLRAAGNEVAAILDQPPADPLATISTPWYGDVALPARALRCHPISETLMHTRDLRLALGGDTGLDRTAAALVAGTIMRDMYPNMPNPVTSRGVHIRYEVHIRGGDRFRLELHDGVCTSGPLDGSTPDCVVSLDPRDVLLIGFARIPLWRSLIRGGAISYGRKPWLGLKLPYYFLVA